MRLCLEPRAAALACGRASLGDIAALKKVTEEVKAAIDRQDFSTAAKRNADFHGLLVGLSDNRLMKRIAGQCFGVLRLALLLSKNEIEPDLQPVNAQLEGQHRDLIQALEARDAGEPKPSPAGTSRVLRLQPSTLRACEKVSGSMNRDTAGSRHVAVALENPFVRRTVAGLAEGVVPVIPDP